MSKNPEALRIIARQMNNAETFRTDELGIEAACLRDSADEIERLRESEAKLREALEYLVDEQNGPPLLGHEHSWRIAMEKARAALGEEKK